MDRERIKLDKKVSNKKDLLKIIEEKEIEIENQKIKLQLANEEIEKIKLELKELKKDISYSIIDRTDNELEEKRSNSFIGITEKEKNNISIEIVEVDEDKPIDEDDFLEGYINKIIDEVTNYEEKQNTDEKVTEDLVLDIVEEKEKNKDDLTLLEKLKSVFIENKNYNSIEILNNILSNINFIDVDITDEEKVLLLYLGYFYNKLEELLNKSKIINEYYNSEVNEIKLLRMLVKEKEYPIYQEAKEIASMEIRYDKKLFKTLDTIVRVRIMDKISNASYRVFDGVYSVKDLKYGEENITLKAWVKEREQNKYRLVEGLYCNTTEKLYMLESSICVLGLNVKKIIDEEIKIKDVQGEKVEDRIYREKEKVNSIINLEETDEVNNYKEEYDIDEEDDDSNIWTRLKEKFGLKLKK
ncbi:MULTISPECIES: hypothetical protein [unclassified Clostridium]|uniref:hypothetical protein n=1 Tax=unclassified Clostridium TaxID=2614128 RepID=UPI00189C07F3|nr:MULTISPECIES: hypothetical protein [unclassified Clostridium]MBP3915635.1 hypothetical protein [Clostridium sp.]MEE0932307.1 hypothetical protein [Clostridium sp.]